MNIKLIIPAWDSEQEMLLSSTSMAEVVLRDRDYADRILRTLQVEILQIKKEYELTVDTAYFVLTTYETLEVAEARYYLARNKTVNAIRSLRKSGLIPQAGLKELKAACDKYKAELKEAGELKS